MQAVHLQYTNIPPELFTEICSFLPPADLFTLSQVCRKFHGYLRAPNSLATQQIWKESRLKFIPNEDMPPPKGMNEEKYVELLMIERGCQICKRSKECKIYWEFAVRCCSNCYSNKTISLSNLTRGINCPRKFIDIIPFIHSGYIYCKRYYWKDQIVFEYSQYYGLSKKSKKFWLDNKKRMFDSIMNYAEQREFKTREHGFIFFYPHSHSNCYFIRDEHYLSTRPFPPTPPSPFQLFRFLATFQSAILFQMNKNVINNYNIITNKFNERVNINNNVNRRVNDIIKDIPQLIQFHIQRLETELYHQFTVNVGVKLTNVFNKKKRNNNSIKIQKQKIKNEFYNRFNTKKGKNSKNKFTHKYG
ncbi:hypothetical protein C1645_824228 [Glomus cerebriforme]|uniref:F-box domain-containing protein n=1 Tax=Glomus cerebriforme TaxID=658196 RepID=A0A397SVX9_9GLOM|nr:hypothetical protein C1645_824228 [Glomus cerebriforme]